MSRINEEDVDRGGRIEDRMHRFGWTDSTLAEELECDRTTVWRWRQGLSIEGRFIGPLVDALETTREWIVAGPIPRAADGELSAEEKSLMESGADDARDDDAHAQAPETGS